MSDENKGTCRHLRHATTDSYEVAHFWNFLNLAHKARDRVMLDGTQTQNDSRNRASNARNRTAC